MSLPGNSPDTAVVSLHSKDRPSGSAYFSSDPDVFRFAVNLPADEVHRRAMAARRLAGKAHHLLAQWLVEMDERKLYAAFGCSSVFMYAELNLHLEGHTVAEYLRTGRALKDYPLLAEAYESGMLSSSKLREITRVVRKETEEHWLDMALTHTTRQIEKMVVFSPRPSQPGETKAGPGIRHCSSAGHTGPVGLQEELVSTSSQRDRPPADCPSAFCNSATFSGDESPVKCENTQAHLCCMENAAAPPSSQSAEINEEQAFSDRVSPHKYHEKMLVELSGEQAAVIRDAFRKARKESGYSDRASLFAYMARTFLEGGGKQCGSSKKPPYQVVIHHHPGAGIAWIETGKGPLYVPAASFERVLCDAEIVELPAAGAEEEERQVNAAEETGDDGRTKEPAHTDGERYGESENPLDGVNRLFDLYRERARSGKERVKKTGKNPTGTMPPALRKKVLLRDGGRCQVPGCGRSQFVHVHHIQAQGAGGRHVLENSLVVCHSCHTLLHEDRIAVEGAAPDRLVWRRA